MCFSFFWICDRSHNEWIWVWKWLNIQQTQQLQIRIALLLQCSLFQSWNHHWWFVNDVSNEVLPDSITRIRRPDTSRLFNLSIMCTLSLSLSHSVAYVYFLNKLAHENSVRLSRFSVIVSCDSSFFFSLRLQKEAAKKHDTLNINGFVADDVLGTSKLQPHTNGTSNKMKWPNCHLRVSLSIFQCFVVQMCVFFSLFQSVYLCGVVAFFRCSFSIHFILVCVDCFFCYNFIKKT